MSERITLQRVKTENLILDAEDIMVDWVNNGNGTPEIASYEVDGDTLRVEFEIGINIPDMFDECAISIDEEIITYDTA